MAVNDFASLLQGEAGGKNATERYNDMLHIASVVVNRSRTSGVPVEDIIANRNEFKAWGKPLPPDTEKYADIARQAIQQVVDHGPVTTATFYSTPSDTGYLPDKLEAATKTKSHEFFTDPLNRAFGTAKGYVQPAAMDIETVPPLPLTAPAPYSPNDWRMEPFQAPYANPLPAPAGRTITPGAGLANLAPNGLGGAQPDFGRIAGKGRNEPTSEKLNSAIDGSIKAVMGPDWTFAPYSGTYSPEKRAMLTQLEQDVRARGLDPTKGAGKQIMKDAGQIGSTRHTSANALDFDVYNPKTGGYLSRGVNDRELNAISREAGARDIIGYGFGKGYMDGGGATRFHMDMARDGIWGGDAAGARAFRSGQYLGSEVRSVPVPTPRPEFAPAANAARSAPMPGFAGGLSPQQGFSMATAGPGGLMAGLGAPQAPESLFPDGGLDRAYKSIVQPGMAGMTPYDAWNAGKEYWQDAPVSMAAAANKERMDNITTFAPHLLDPAPIARQPNDDFTASTNKSTMTPGTMRNVMSSWEKTTPRQSAANVPTMAPFAPASPGGPIVMQPGFPAPVTAPPSITFGGSSRGGAGLGNVSSPGSITIGPFGPAPVTPPAPAAAPPAPVTVAPPVAAPAPVVAPPAPVIAPPAPVIAPPAVVPPVVAPPPIPTPAPRGNPALAFRGGLLGPAAKQIGMNLRTNMTGGKIGMFAGVPQAYRDSFGALAGMFNQNGPTYSGPTKNVGSGYQAIASVFGGAPGNVAYANNGDRFTSLGNGYASRHSDQYGWDMMMGPGDYDPGSGKSTSSKGK